MMDKTLKKKLGSLSREELLELLEELCRYDDAAKTVKLLVSPSERDVDDLLNSFRRWCSSYENGSRSNRTVNEMCRISSLLFISSEKLGVRKSAGIAYEIYDECEQLSEYGDDFLFDIKYEAQCCIEEALKSEKCDFTEEEIQRYSYIVEDE